MPKGIYTRTHLPIMIGKRFGKLTIKIFNVTDANISNICQRHTWRHI